MVSEKRKANEPASVACSASSCWEWATRTDPESYRTPDLACLYPQSLEYSLYTRLADCLQLKVAQKNIINNLIINKNRLQLTTY